MPLHNTIVGAQSMRRFMPNGIVWSHWVHWLVRKQRSCSSCISELKSPRAAMNVNCLIPQERTKHNHSFRRIHGNSLLVTWKYQIPENFRSTILGGVELRSVSDRNWLLQLSTDTFHLSIASSEFEVKNGQYGYKGVPEEDTFLSRNLDHDFLSMFRLVVTLLLEWTPYAFSKMSITQN